MTNRSLQSIFRSHTSVLNNLCNPMAVEDQAICQIFNPLLWSCFCFFNKNDHWCDQSSWLHDWNVLKLLQSKSASLKQLRTKQFARLSIPSCEAVFSFSKRSFIDDLFVCEWTNPHCVVCWVPSSLKDFASIPSSCDWFFIKLFSEFSVLNMCWVLCHRIFIRFVSGVLAGKKRITIFKLILAKSIATPGVCGPTTVHVTVLSYATSWYYGKTVQR